MTFVRWIGLDHDIVNIRTSLYNALAVHFFKVASDDIDYASAKGFTGELTTSVKDQYGDLDFTFTLEADGTIQMHCSAYGGFISYDDKGTYIIQEDGTILATFTEFTESMRHSVTEHNDSFVIEKGGALWVIHYTREMQGMDKVDATGELTPVQ